MSLLSVSAFSQTQASLSEGAVNVDLDASLLVQLALFVVLLLVLKPLLFDPMMKLFDEREERIEKTVQKARRIDADSAVARQTYENIMAKAAAAGNAEADQLRLAATKTDADALAIVRTTVAETLNVGRGVTGTEAEATRKGLEGEVRLIGCAIASKVLGRDVSEVSS